MKALLLLLLVYANMGFTTADKIIPVVHPHAMIRPASECREGSIIVASPGACLVLTY